MTIAVLIGVLALLVSLTRGGTPPPTPVTLSTALADVSGHHVAKAAIDDAAHTVVLTLKDGRKAKADPNLLDSTSGKPAARTSSTVDPSREVAVYPYAYGVELTKQLLAADVPLKTEPVPTENPWTALLFSLLPIVLIVGALIWLARSGALTGGVGKFSGKRGQQLGEVPKTRFTDVAGADEAVAELAEFVEFLKDPSRFEKVGAKRPAGALLCGDPGTGKTLLARAVAGEAGVPFFAVAGSDFVETFVGVGAKRVRDLFDKAKAAGQAILFIDEIDAVGRTRGGSGPSQGGADERENTLISLLNEMDGFEGSNVVVLAATNRPEVLDPALKRPGRLDREIQVPLPDRRGRELILRVHGRGRPIADDVDYVAVARRTPGMSGAELGQLVNEACMEAARRTLDLVDQGCFDAAVATIAMGRARTSALVTEHDRQVTAWHEAGHTLAALLLPDADDPVSVSIVPRGPAGGVTWMSGNDDMFLTRRKALARLTVALAGRAAEEMLLAGEYTQGAAGDLQSATNLAQAMVTQYGMTGFGYAQVDADVLRLGGELAVRVHGEVDGLLQDAHAGAVALLAEQPAAMAALAAALLEEETLSAAQIRVVVGAHVQPAACPETTPTTRCPRPARGRGHRSVPSGSRP
ncbi:MAG: ATP-dependent metallopeptidase FtsH/Yme1/Tma family protein, partial [Nocardioidaceae bacterium]